ncbi:hypothetical protein ACPA9J_14465 [Pseudomonas aeruginosa]
MIDVCCLKVDCPLYGEDYVAVIHTAPQVQVRLPALAPAATRHPPRAQRVVRRTRPAAERRQQARPPCARRPAAAGSLVMCGILGTSAPVSVSRASPERYACWPIAARSARASRPCRTAPSA